jgi:hypothetical protein
METDSVTELAAKPTVTTLIDDWSADDSLGSPKRSDLEQLLLSRRGTELGRDCISA